VQTATCVIILLGGRERRVDVLTQVPPIVHRRHTAHVPNPAVEVPYDRSRTIAAALHAVEGPGVVYTHMEVGAVDVGAASTGDGDGVGKRAGD
jgi:hypothetical protein